MESMIIENEMSYTVEEEEQISRGYFKPENGIIPVERLIKLAHENNVNFIAGIPRPLLFKLHYLPDELLSKFHLAEYFSTEISTMKQIVSASASLAGAPFCLFQTNMVIDEADFADFLTYSTLQKDALGVLCVEDTLAERRTMKVSLAEDDTITRIAMGGNGYKWTAAGIYFFQPEVIKYIKAAAGKGINEIIAFIKYLVDEKTQLKAFVLS